jgi:hypothetical protein
MSAVDTTGPYDIALARDRLTFKKAIGGNPSVVLPIPSQSDFIARVSPPSPMPALLCAPP